MSGQEQLNHLTTAIGIVTRKLDEIGKKVDDTNNKVDETNNKVDEMKKILETRVETLELKVDDIESRLEIVERMMDHQHDNSRRVNNLLLNGVPYSTGENIREIFNAVAAKLGFATPPDADVFRMKGNDDNKRPVVLKFSTEFHKNQFLGRYYKVSKSLDLSVVKGYEDKKSRLFLQHDFTTTQYKLFREALKQKKEGVVKSVRVTDGSVSVKFAEDGPAWKFSTDAALLEAINKKISEKKKGAPK